MALLWHVWPAIMRLEPHVWQACIPVAVRSLDLLNCEKKNFLLERGLIQRFNVSSSSCLCLAPVPDPQPRRLHVACKVENPDVWQEVLRTSSHLRVHHRLQFPVEFGLHLLLRLQSSLLLIQFCMDALDGSHRL